MERIKIIVGEEGILHIEGVPAGIEIEVEDMDETFALYGEGKDNILSLKV